jgi:hypothetical protein
MQGLTMSQISPPVRILLVGCVLFLAAWMTVLKPKSPEAPAPAPTAATPRVEAGGEQAGTALGKAVESANNASKAQGAANARHGDESQSAPSTTSSAPATAAEKKPAGSPAAAKTSDAETAGLPLPVAKAVAEKKILVMLFWNPKAADDRAVRREMRSVGSRHRKDVFVHIADVKNISRYAPVTRGANVEQSPSVVVVGRDRQATLLEGYSDRETIRQAVYDALRTK